MFSLPDNLFQDFFYVLARQRTSCSSLSAAKPVGQVASRLSHLLNTHALYLQIEALESVTWSTDKIVPRIGASRSAKRWIVWGDLPQISAQSRAVNDRIVTRFPRTTCCFRRQVWLAVVS